MGVGQRLLEELVKVEVELLSLEDLRKLAFESSCQPLQASVDGQINELGHYCVLDKDKDNFSSNLKLRFQIVQWHRGLYYSFCGEVPSL